MEFLAISVALVAVSVIWWWWNRRALYSTWSRMGIKGPAPRSLLLGNLAERFNTGYFQLNAKWSKEYGKIYGYYEGSTPVLSVADPDMAREILIKQFHKFGHRIPTIDNTDDPHADMFVSKGEQWKRVRGVSSPTFSGRKMKMMSPLVHQSIEKLMKRFSDRVEKNNDFDIYGDFQCLTLDVIASTVFSFDTDIFNDSDSIFLKKMRELFDSLSPATFPWYEQLKLSMFLVFPSLLPIAKKFKPRVAALKNSWFIDLAKTMITERENSGEVRPDYIQLMLNLKKKPDGNESGSDTDNDMSDNEMAAELRSNAKTKFLTMDEMQAQTFIFLVAGYETTATTLGFIAYYLALYPDVQAKLQQEIDEHFPIEGKNINYETVQKLSYLDMVFCETSRLASIAQFGVQRMCTETTKVGNITIPKGTRVMVNVSEIHANLELWGPEPTDQFVPERFLPERKGARHSMAYLPFGAGPRNCIGMRFALMEAKMALINMMQRYTIVKCDTTQVPLKMTKDGVCGPAEGVYVRLQGRE